jgi:HD superfamily phosphohydrolase
VDSEGHLCLTGKALRAADHFLVSRYYDYTQVAYHKTVVGLEEVLKDVIAELVKRGLDCSGPAIKKSILDGSFSTFDDHAVISQMRNALKDCGADDEIFSRKLNSVLKRQAPKLVAASERIAPRTQESDYLNNVDQLKRGVAGWANEFGIPVDLWHLWKAKLNLSKIGSTISVGEADDDAFDEEKQQIVRILTTHQHDAVSKSKPLIEHDFALMKQLANVRLYSMRLYVHLPEDVEAPGELRHAITRKIKADLPHFPFSS